MMHKATYRVYYEDTDAGGVVYYANYLKFAERARTDWLRQQFDISQSEWMAEKQRGFVVREVNALFHKPAKLDDEIEVDTKVIETGSSFLKMEQHLYRDEILLTEITATIVHVDTDKMSPKRLPDSLTKL